MTDATTHAGMILPLGLGLLLGALLSFAVLVASTFPPPGMSRVRAALDRPRWALLRMRRPSLHFAYRDQDVVSYAQMLDMRSRGWEEPLILAAALHQGGFRWPPRSNVRPVMEAMTVEAFATFADASCPIWMDDPILAQQWVDTFRDQAVVLVRAGLAYDEAVALDSQGRLDDESVDTLAALRAPAV